MLFNLNEDASLRESPNNEQADSSSDSNSDSEEEVPDSALETIMAWSIRPGYSYKE